MIALALILSLQAQASDVRIVPALPSQSSGKTATDLTQPGYDFECAFAKAGERPERIRVELRGGRGYETGQVKRPFASTLLIAAIRLNETQARFSATLEPRLSDGAFVIESRSAEQFIANLVIQSDWSGPDFGLDGSSSANLSWGPIIDSGSRRWFQNSKDGKCRITEVSQLPLSDAEAQEFLAQ